MVEYTMHGKSKGFTLIELIIAVVLSLFIVITILELYATVQKVYSSINRAWDNAKALHLAYIVQKQLLASKDVEVSDNRISYTTLFGLSIPFVRVEIILEGKGIRYRELNPYDMSLIYETTIGYNHKANFTKHDRYISLDLDDKTYNLIVYQIQPPPPLLLRRKIQENFR